MSTEKFNLICLQYPEYYQVAKNRKTLYYKRNTTLGKKLQKAVEDGKAEWRYNPTSKNDNLYDIETDTFIIKNAKTAGTARNKPINSQMLWSGGFGSEWDRKKLDDFLKLYYKPLIIRNMPEKLYAAPGFYIHLEYIFYYPFKLRKGKYQDYINHFYVRGKVFEDCLVELGVLTDDNPDILRGGYARYVEVDTEEERRLEIKVHFCRNNERIC